MIENFENITESEFENLKKAISWITVLIAGADNNIRKEETEWATKLTQIRSYANAEVLNDFYKEVGSGFQTQLDELIDSLPNSVDERNSILTDRLAMVNDILPKLDPKIAYRLYLSYTSFAGHVAKASGGFLRFFTVSKEEKKLMGLDMINPIPMPPEDED